MWQQNSGLEIVRFGKSPQGYARRHFPQVFRQLHVFLNKTKNFPFFVQTFLNKNGFLNNIFRNNLLDLDPGLSQNQAVLKQM